MTRNYNHQVTEIGRKYMRARTISLLELPGFVAEMKRVIDERLKLASSSQMTLPGLEDNSVDRTEEIQQIIDEAISLAVEEVDAGNVTPQDLPQALGKLIDSLAGFTPPAPEPAPQIVLTAPQQVNPNEMPTYPPAVPVEESIHQDYLICLEDGARVTLLKRYLQNRYKMTPEQYRRRWKLPYDYPMTAPAYTARRAEIAHNTGLGHRRKKSA